MSALKAGMVVNFSYFGNIFFVKLLTARIWMCYNNTK